jgi:hypothetical protein
MEETTMDGVLEVLMNFSEEDANTKVVVPGIKQAAVKATLPTATRAQVEPV